ncbi:MAG: ribonuclease P protein component [Paludibacteraceae bacterium]
MNSFPKSERLCGNKAIENLHKTGNAFIAYPFRVVFLDVSNIGEKNPVRVMTSASKKKFKKAVHRNRIKRLTRESYRMNKSELILFTTSNNLKLHIAFQYISEEIPDFIFVNVKMQKALTKVINILSENKRIKHEND